MSYTINILEMVTTKGAGMKYKQMELELGNFRVLQAIREAQKKRNEEAKKRFFSFVHKNFKGEKK